MYFEEPWFVDFCVRLNCFQHSLMSSNVQSENLEDFEEGEIVDDDDCNVSCNDVSDLKQNFDNSSIFSKRFGCENVTSRSPDNFSEPTRSGPSHLPSETNPRGKEPSKFNSVRRANRQRNSRLRYRRKRAGNLRIPPRNNSYNTYRNRRQINNVRDRSRAGTPYEEKLKDFQIKMRQQRNHSKLEPQDKTSGRASANRHNAGTSLLKRLVGSGSVGIKLLDDNILEPSKCNTPLHSGDNIKGVKYPVNDTPVPGSLNNSITQSDLVNEIDYSQGTTESHIGDTKKVLNLNEKMSDSSSDLDNELMELRMEALKTVVLKKHSERLKRGYVPKKTIKDIDDPVIDSFIEEVESLIDLDPADVLSSTSPCNIKSDDLNNALGDYSDMSMDSNYVSDDDGPGQSLPPSVDMDIPKTPDMSGVKRPLSDDLVPAKKLKLDESSRDSNDMSTDNIISDLNDEELQLRALALKSFLDKKALKDNDADSDKNSEPLDVSTKEEIDETESKTELGEVKTLEESKDLENWEELDEDILRAQLLKTLSSNLPEHTVLDEDVPDEPDSIRQNIVKSISSSKKDIDAELDLQSKLWSEMMVPKLIISLGSDSESDPESKPVDFVKSLDLLLQEAKEKSEKMSAKGVLKPKIKKKTTSPKHPLMKQLVKKGPPVTPVAVKHLPKLQQEEYRRLKMMLAEKLKLNKPKNFTKAPPIIPRMQPPTPPKKLNPKQQLQKLDKTVISKSDTNVSLKQKPVPFVTKPSEKLVSHESNDSIKKLNVPVGINLTKKSSEAVDMPVSITPKSQALLNSRTKVVNKVAPVVNTKRNVPASRDTKINLPNKTVVPQPHSSLTNTTLNKPTIRTDLKNSSSKTNASVASKIGETFQLKTCEVNEPGLVNLCKDDIEKAVELKENKDDNFSDENSVTKISGANIKKELSVEMEIEKPVLMDKQARLVSKDKSSQVSKSVTVKDNEGNSDKENENFKDKTIFVRTEEKDLDFVERSSLLESRLSPDQNLTQKLRDAENNYEETLTLISRLEKELEEAKKMLTERGQTVAELKELIKGPKDLATLSVKVSGGDDSNKNISVSITENIVELNSSNIENCWDPDGVLCPFQLAGCCKDPSCSFHHIQS